MATFRFKLESLLTCRRIREEQAQQLMVREQQVLAEHLLRLTEIRAERAALITAFEARKQTEKLSPLLFAFYIEQLEYKEKEVRDRQRTLELQQRSVEKAQQALTEAVQKRKMIERVREKAQHEHIKELLRLEQSDNDERAVLRHGRGPVDSGWTGA